MRRKRNFGEPPDLYDAALAHEYLIETSTVLELNGDDLVPETCLPTSLQLIEQRFRDRK
jgi:hypothetical protein